MTTTTFKTRLAAPRLPLHDLFHGLRPAGRYLSTSELGMLVEELAQRPSLWAPRMQRPDDERGRWWTRLHGDNQVDIWLLTWLPGGQTELHDHGTSAAALTVVRGLLEETRPTPTGGRLLLNHGTGQTSRVEPGIIHDVRALSGEPAGSIHAYSPPLREMTYWLPGPDGRLRRDHTVISREPEQESA